jgi:transcriptional regulator with XRE-family HTH domain
MMEISTKIQQQRKLSHISQNELSKRVGVSLKTVQRWESGERSPRFEEVNKLADSLNVPVSYFVDDDNPELPISQTIHMIPTKDSSPHETNMSMAILTLENGKKIEAPATPEGYAFLERLFARSLGTVPAAMA